MRALNILEPIDLKYRIMMKTWFTKIILMLTFTQTHIFTITLLSFNLFFTNRTCECLVTTWHHTPQSTANKITYPRLSILSVLVTLFVIWLLFSECTLQDVRYSLPISEYSRSIWMKINIRLFGLWAWFCLLSLGFSANCSL